FDPAKVGLAKPEVSLFFENLLIDNRTVYANDKSSPLIHPLNETDQLKLKHNQNSFSLDFTSIVPSGTGEIKYSWMLAGQDKEWTLPSLNKTANYTNLEKGEYIFKLRAFANENDLVLDERTIAVTIKPAPWDTLWAKALYVLALFSIVIAVLSYNTIKNKKRLSEAKIKFFMNTAHDICTPLTLAMAPLSDLEKSHNLNKMDKYYLGLSTTNLGKLSNMIDILMDFQKSDLGKAHLILNKMDIRKILENKTAYFAPVAKQKGIKFTFFSNKEELLEYVDIQKFDKILDNLLSNALKYTPEGGAVAVRLESGEKRWKIEVEDTGIGIATNSQKDLFKRYYRGNNAINSKITGTGIGLLLTRNYVSLHKGKIDFESKEGVGTKFVIGFYHGKKHFGNNVTFSDTPKANSQDSVQQMISTPPHEESRKERKKLKLLVAEDNQSLREYLQNSLSRFYNVKTAENGKIALALIEQYAPDIVVSDVGMPIMNGRELTNHIKTKYETSHIPVILLTAYREKKDIIQGLESGADEYITKPFDTTLLLAKIESILENRRLVRKRFKRLHKNKLKKGTYTNTRDQEFVQNAINFVQKNILNPNLSKEYFAREMLVSQTLLYQKLKTLTGQSPTDFIRTIKLRHAAKLLNEGSYTINEIATLAGFSDAKYFSTCFKKFYGKSPTAYAKSA
ncbi:MAG: hybrid sensor histidine kinase/response regulator transcription factor, partial [Bacteroidota bacterium]